MMRAALQRCVNQGRGYWSGIVFALIVLGLAPRVQAEGSGELGTNQYFLDVSQAAAFGLDANGTSQFVDILSAGEVITSQPVVSRSKTICSSKSTTAPMCWSTRSP